MSFTDQKPHVLDEKLAAAFERFKKCRCYLCGTRFKVGDTFRWVYTNDTEAHGNPLVCVSCDTEDVIDRWKEMHRQWKQIEKDFWWFVRNIDDA